MKKDSVKRLLLSMNALGLGLSEYGELELLTEVGEWEEALELLEYFKRQNRLSAADYEALTDLFKAAAASLPN